MPSGRGALFWESILCSHFFFSIFWCLVLSFSPFSAYLRLGFSASLLLLFFVSSRWRVWSSAIATRGHWRYTPLKDTAKTSESNRLQKTPSFNMQDHARRRNWTQHDTALRYWNPTCCVCEADEILYGLTFKMSSFPKAFVGVHRVKKAALSWWPWTFLNWTSNWKWTWNSFPSISCWACFISKLHEGARHRLSMLGNCFTIGGDIHMKFNRFFELLDTQLFIRWRPDFLLHSFQLKW